MDDELRRFLENMEDMINSAKEEVEDDDIVNEAEAEALKIMDSFSDEIIKAYDDATYGLLHKPDAKITGTMAMMGMTRFMGQLLYTTYDSKRDFDRAMDFARGLHESIMMSMKLSMSANKRKDIRCMLFACLATMHRIFGDMLPEELGITGDKDKKDPDVSPEGKVSDMTMEEFIKQLERRTNDEK